MSLSLTAAVICGLEMIPEKVPNINESGNPQSDFLDKVYKPESPTLQFTFRGSVIFRSIINELMVNGVV